MSESTRYFKEITARDRAENGVVSLAIRPNMPSQYGEGSLSGKQLQQRFDRLAGLIIERYNTMASALSSNEILEYFKLPDEYSFNTLLQLIERISDTSGNLITEDPESGNVQPIKDILKKIYILLSVVATFVAIDEQEKGKTIQDIYATIAALEEHNNTEASHPYILNKITTDIESHNTSSKSHSDIRKAIREGDKEQAKLLLDHDSSEIAHRQIRDATTKEIKDTIDNHNKNTVAHQDIRVTITLLSDALSALEDVVNEFLTGDEDNDGTLDRLKEIVAYIGNNKELIEILKDDKIDKTDIATSLTVDDETKVLAASVGKQIKELVSTSVKGLVSDTPSSEAIKGFVTQTIVDKIVADAVKDLAKSSDLEGLVTEEELNEALDNFTPSGGGNIGSNLDEDAQEIFSIAFLTNGSMGLQYQLQDGLACFNGIGTCIDEDIRIGSMIKGIPVKRMYDTIFNGSTVKSIFIPKSVEAIDGEEQYNPIFEDCLFLERIIVEENNEVYRSTNQSVLYNRQSERLVRCPQCTKNELIIVPDSILTIGIGAFTRVINVTAIYISENLQSVEAEAFNDNSTLTDIFWSGTERSWRSLFVDQGNEAFENATKHYMGYLEYVEHSNYFACTGIGEYTGDKIVIPSATEGYPEKPVLEIGNNANTFDRATFTGAENLTSVALTDRIELIRPGAFYGCSNLQQVVLGDGVVSIGRSAFEGTGISDITLTQNVDDIDGQAFRNCTQLKKIVITNRDRVINLHATSAFANTPIDNDTGEIFVYKKLLSKYRNATNWSVYASVIKAIEDHPEVLERGIKWQ